jgi:hypothetical protein
LDGGSRDHALRKQVRSLLPIALFALVLQILAPIGASWIAAGAMADPLRGIEICHSEADAESAPADQDGDRHACGIDCLLCCVLHAGAGALDAPHTAVLAVPLRPTTEIVWRGDDFDLPHVRDVSHAQARAPPNLS